LLGLRPFRAYATGTAVPVFEGVTLVPDMNAVAATGVGGAPTVTGIAVAFTRIFVIVKLVVVAVVVIPVKVMPPGLTDPDAEEPPLLAVAVASVAPVVVDGSNALVTVTAGEKKSWMVAEPAVVPVEQVTLIGGSNSVWPSALTKVAPLGADSAALVVHRFCPNAKPENTIAAPARPKSLVRKSDISFSL
jgi:hypothetical protein